MNTFCERILWCCCTWLQFISVYIFYMGHTHWLLIDVRRLPNAISCAVALNLNVFFVHVSCIQTCPAYRGLQDTTSLYKPGPECMHLHNSVKRLTSILIPVCWDPSSFFKGFWNTFHSIARMRSISRIRSFNLSVWSREGQTCFYFMYVRLL